MSCSKGTLGALEAMRVISGVSVIDVTMIGKKAGKDILETKKSVEGSWKTAK